MKYLARYNFDCEYDNGPGVGTSSIKANTLEELKAKLLEEATSNDGWGENPRSVMRNIRIYEMTDTLSIEDLDGYTEALDEYNRREEARKERERLRYEQQQRDEFERLKAKFEGK